MSFSFFPLDREKNYEAGKLSHTLLLKKDFLEKKKEVFKDIEVEKRLFTFPLFLTTDGRLVVSHDKFLILSHGERKEISHFSFKELQNFIKESLGEEILSLKDVLSFFPQGNLLFFLEDMNFEKLLKKLDELNIKTKFPIFFASSHMLLLEQVKKINPEFQTLSTFKQVIRLQILSLFRPLMKKSFASDGIIFPLNFKPSLDLIRFLEEDEKWIFREKNPPYTKKDTSIKKQGIISNSEMSSFKDCKD